MLAYTKIWLSSQNFAFIVLIGWAVGQGDFFNGLIILKNKGDYMDHLVRSQYLSLGSLAGFKQFERAKKSGKPR